VAEMVLYIVTVFLHNSGSVEFYILNIYYHL